MRTYILLLAIISNLFISCGGDNSSLATISILEDKTEQDFLQSPNAEQALRLLGVESDLWRSYTFRYGTLTDLSYNNRFEVSIEAQHPLLGNELERKVRIDAFKEQVSKVFVSTADSLVRDHSAIWEPIVSELIALQKDTLGKSRLYIYSDLRENADFFSVYRHGDNILLANSIDNVVDLYLAKVSGVHPSNRLSVVVVFQPSSRAEDVSFKQLSKLYRKVFNRLGISIDFVTNLNTSAL